MKCSRTVLTFGLTLWVPRLLPEWSSKQTVVGIRISNKQFKGTTFSMVLDVQVWFPWCKQQYLVTIMQPVYLPIYRYLYTYRPIFSSIPLSCYLPIYILHLFSPAFFFKHPGTSQHRFPSFFEDQDDPILGCDVENHPQLFTSKGLCFCFSTSLSEHNPKHPWYTPGEGILHASYSKPQGLFEARKTWQKKLKKGCISAGKGFIGYQ